MKNVYKKVELAANLAIILVAVALLAAVTKYYLWPSPQTQILPNQSQIKVGDKLNLSNIDWRSNESTLVMVLQKGCRYCEESASFYQRLTRALEGRADVRLVAALPQDAGESKAYLSGLGVDVRDVVQVPPSSFGVRGTPTLMLVNRAGEVRGIWSGMLNSEQEAKVSEQLGLTLSDAQFSREAGRF
jgi:thioredoxin-related protein